MLYLTPKFRFFKGFPDEFDDDADVPENSKEIEGSLLVKFINADSEQLGHWQQVYAMVRISTDEQCDYPWLVFFPSAEVRQKTDCNPRF